MRMSVIAATKLFDLGFSVAYFQVPWALSRGALQTFGVEAAYVNFTLPPNSFIQNVF